MPFLLSAVTAEQRAGSRGCRGRATRRFRRHARSRPAARADPTERGGPDRPRRTREASTGSSGPQQPSRCLRTPSRASPNARNCSRRHLVEQVAAHAVDVAARGDLERGVPLVGHPADDAAPVVRAGLALHVAPGLQPTDGVGQPAARVDHALRQVGHPDRTAGALREVDQDLVLVVAEAVAGQVALDRGVEQSGGTHIAAPRALFLGVEPPDVIGHTADGSKTLVESWNIYRYGVVERATTKARPGPGTTTEESTFHDNHDRQRHHPLRPDPRRPGPRRLGRRRLRTPRSASPPAT